MRSLEANTRIQFGAFKHRAMRGGRGYRVPERITLTLEDFAALRATERCHYCRRRFVAYEFAKGRLDALTIDRKVPGGDYSSENCVAACMRCNQFKGHRLTYDQMLIVGRAFAEAGI